MRLATSVDRPAKFVVFYVKMFFFLTKNNGKIGVHNLAENGRFFQFLLQKCFLGSLDRIWCILDHNIIFMNFGSISNFGEKVENFPKVKFHRNFSAVNSLEKIHKISQKKFKKFEKLYFFLNVLTFYLHNVFLWDLPRL